MFVLGLLNAALAAPPRVGLAVGPVVGGGTSSLGGYVSAAPAGALTVTWPFGPLEAWAGVSASGLMAAYGDGVIPAALLQGELGVGVGGPSAGGGLYFGNGVPGPLAGVYARVLFPGSGWARRIGVEGRLFQTSLTESTGLALLVRVEPGAEAGERRPPRAPGAPRRPPPGPPPPRPPPAEAGETTDAPPPGEEPSTVLPAGETPPPDREAPAPESPTDPSAAPPADEAATQGTHHDEPY